MYPQFFSLHTVYKICCVLHRLLLLAFFTLNNWSISPGHQLVFRNTILMTI